MKRFLHVDHDGSDLLSKLRLDEFPRQGRVLLGDAVSQDQLGDLVGECVAIVRKDVIVAFSELGGHVSEHFHENLFGDFSLS